MQRNSKDSAAKLAAEKSFLTKKRSLPTVDELANGIPKGDRFLLAKGITLLESELPEKQKLGYELLDRLNTVDGKAIQIGISGPPGVGKSTFIEALGSYLVDQGLKLAVLAIDPSSQKTRGSILGDKTRMEALSKNENAFIRPSPAGKTLGGVAAKTQETIQLVEAAGFDVILIETVGVGQSEWEVYSMVDCFLLLLQPGGGDELQGIKKGVVEMADLIAVNKSDGPHMDLANQTKLSYLNALHLFPKNPNGWTTKVNQISALENIGIEDLWKNVNDFFKLVKENGHFEERRKAQALDWYEKHLNQLVWQSIYNKESLFEIFEEQKDQIIAGKIKPIQAARAVFQKYSKTPKE